MGYSVGFNSIKSIDSPANVEHMMRNTKFIARPSTLGAALATAAMKVDHQSIRPDNWIARRVVDNAENSRIGVITEPAVNAHLSFKTAKALGFVD